MEQIDYQYIAKRSEMSEKQFEPQSTLRSDCAV